MKKKEAERIVLALTKETPDAFLIVSQYPSTGDAAYRVSTHKTKRSAQYWLRYWQKMAKPGVRYQIVPA